jgi:hypothetical protein
MLLARNPAIRTLTWCRSFNFTGGRGDGVGKLGHKNVETKIKFKDAISAWSTLTVWDGMIRLLKTSKVQLLEWRGFGTKKPNKPQQGERQGGAIGPGQYQVGHQRHSTQMVEVAALEDNIALAEANFFSKEAQGLDSFFPNPLSVSVGKGQWEQRGAVEEDMLSLLQ